MDQRRVLVERVHLAEHGRQDFVLDVYQVDGPAGDVQAFGRHSDDGLAEVPHGILGQDVLVHDIQADPVVELLAGEHRVHAREVLGLGGVDRQDLRPGMRAPLHLGMQHAGKYEVACVDGRARQLCGVVGPLDVVTHVGCY